MKGDTFFSGWFLRFLAVLCLIGWGLAAPAHAFYVGHIREPFTLSNEPGVLYERHYIWPARGDFEFASDGYIYLNALADQLYQDAHTKGYMAGPSRWYYSKELAQYRSGQWPILFITKAGSTHALRHFCFANRLDDSPLPWEDRFLGDNDGILPQTIAGREEVVIGASFPFRPHPLLPEASDPANRELLDYLGYFRPTLAGERTELKFLLGDSPALFRELLRGALKFQPHRWSGRPTTESGWKKVADGVKHFGLREKALPWIRRMHLTRDANAVADALFHPELQPYIQNSSVYCHVSGMPVGAAQETGLSRIFQTKLQLNWPVYSFLESASIGTPGIRTDIYEMTLGYFETQVARSLDNAPNLSGVEAVYACPSLLTNALR